MVSAGDVADGEIIVTPFGTATLFAIAVVTPEQSAPIIAATLSAVTNRSAADVAAAASIQVESALTGLRVDPLSIPASVASLKAISAEDAIVGVKDSIGPVKPRIIPTFISLAATSSFCCEQPEISAIRETPNRTLNIDFFIINYLLYFCYKVFMLAK